MEEEFVIDNDVLISLVEAKPVLWDKSLPIYKDRNATRDAWREVCCVLNSDFEEMEVKEKNVFGAAVTKRWTNVRDAFSKSKKKLKDVKKSGSRAPTIKKYVYADQMQFLDKLYQSRKVTESLEDINVSNDNGDDDVEQIQPGLQETEEVVGLKRKNKNPATSGRKRRCPDDLELKMIKALEEPTPNAHMSFFQGPLPHLSRFDDSDVLEFQMGVLQVISKINDKKRIAQLPAQAPPYYHPTYTSLQPPSFPQPNPPFPNHPPQSFVNLLNAAPFPNQQFYHSQNNIPNTPVPNNQQDSSLMKQQPQTQQTTASFYQQLDNTPAPATSTDNTSSGTLSPSLSVCTDSIGLDFC